MDLNETMKAAVQAYIDGFNVGDPQAVADLFADDATVEDPFGTPPKSGKDEILAFYTMAMQSGSKLVQEGNTRLAANRAAFAFVVHVGGLTADNTAVDVDLPTGAMQIDVIDIFEFNQDGKITTMTAHWGPTNVRKIS